MGAGGYWIARYGTIDVRLPYGTEVMHIMVHCHFSASIFHPLCCR